ncbi:hypothetical protein Pcinc_021073 [Petrolisthes cinctipes]|uniref:Uncharacterized protein n=1 Tax=Petrolisthes cinctipes TaxID=88211 RepID=A0AAE1FGM8_PETCI|nr:hypothetical protein Pcinc_021073 [Petrolisthes cinctipes]
MGFTCSMVKAVVTLEGRPELDPQTTTPQKVKICSREGFQQNGWITLCGNICVLGDAAVGPSYGRCSRPLEVLLLVRESGK